MCETVKYGGTSGDFEAYRFEKSGAGGGCIPKSRTSFLFTDGVYADMSIQNPLGEPPDARRLGRLVMQDLRTQLRTKLLSEP